MVYTIFSDWSKLGIKNGIRDLLWLVKSHPPQKVLVFLLLWEDCNIEKSIQLPPPPPQELIIIKLLFKLRDVQQELKET